MAYYEEANAWQNLTGDSTDNTHEALTDEKGPEADNWVVRKLTELYEKSDRIKELPIFSISAGTINGSTAPQDIKDLASNWTTYLSCIALRQFEAAKEYKGMALDQLKTIETGLQNAENIFTPAAIV